MATVITRLCRDCVDSACVEVCPTDAILIPRDVASSGLPNQLFIDPERCIDCGACEPECPWQAISLDDDVPRLFVDDIALNALTVTRPHDFVSAPLVKKPRPTPDEVDENRRRWEAAAQSFAFSGPAVSNEG